MFPNIKLQFQIKWVNAMEKIIWRSWKKLGQSLISWFWSKFTKSKLSTKVNYRSKFFFSCMNDVIDICMNANELLNENESIYFKAKMFFVSNCDFPTQTSNLNHIFESCIITKWTFKCTDELKVRGSTKPWMIWMQTRKLEYV